MQFTILRAVRELEMEVDFEHMTDVPNIDIDEYGMTVYGTETRGGELYYLVFDRELVRKIVSEYYQDEQQNHPDRHLS